MRLIDADKLEYMQIGTNAYVRAEDILSAKPVDAVPVIRCDKCDFWDRDHISCEGLAKCLTGEGGIRYRNRSDFCSKGRKKDGDHHEE